MKKVLALGVATLCTLGVAGMVFATEVTTTGGNEVQAEYNVGSKYTITIPANITFTEDKMTVDEVVSASNVRINSGETLRITMKSANGKLSNGDSYIPYSFKIGDAETQITSTENYNLLSVSDGAQSKSTNIKFIAGGLDHVTVSGRHADTLTFTVDRILLANEDFITGCYYNDGTLKNDGTPWNKIKTIEKFITPQKVEVVVTDTENNVADGNYLAVVSAWDSQKNIMNPNDFTGSKYNLVNGKVTIDLPTRYPNASYFKIDIMSYTTSTSFGDIPSTAVININSVDE